jgi:uncharacterized protein YbaP (TraB family)
MKKHLLLLLFLTITITLSAQYADTRLWRISGNNLPKVSYLYGSMHVDDERVFNFSDSLFYALSSCEVFANEVSVDSVLKFLYQTIDNRFQKKLENEYFGDDEEALDEVSQSTGLDKMTLKKMSPVVLKQLIPAISGSKNRKQAMLDNYLYNIARHEGKTCIGIENLDTQIALFNDFPEETKKEITDYTISKKRNSKNSQLVEIYHKADLNAVELLLKTLSPDLVKAMFTDRNLGMAHNIDSISRQRSAFYTIGFGHLPGELGLINLLRNKGYKVEPVFETFTGMAAKFPFKKIEIPWVAFADTRTGYSVEMPGQSYTSPNFPSGVNHAIYFDMGTNSFYMVLARASSTFNADTDIDSLTRAFAKNAWNIDASDTKITKVIHEGIEFRQMDKLKMTQFYISLRIAVDNGKLYILVGLNSDDKENKDFNRFFNSFRIIDKVSENWYTFSSPKGGYSVDFPGYPKENVFSDPSKEDNESIVGMISGIDDDTGNEFLVQYIDTKTSFFPSDSLILSIIMTNSVAKAKEGTIESEYTTFGGFPALKYSFEMQSGQFLRIIALVKGTRIYNLISAQSAAKKTDPQPDRLFDSFRFLPASRINWVNRTSEKGYFSVLSPTDFEITADEYFPPKYTSSDEFNSFDEFTGDKIVVLRYVFSPYYSSTVSDSSFFTDFYHDQISGSDSIISLQKVAETPLTYSVYAKSEKSHLVTNARIVLSGRSMIACVAKQAGNQTDSTFAAKCVNSFFTRDTTEPGSLAANKTALLLSDLTSGDTLRIYPAKKALSFYEFEPEEIPLVWQTFYHDFGDDSLDYGSTRVMLFNSIGAKLDSVYKEKLIASFDTLCPNSYSKLEGLYWLVNDFNPAYRDFISRQLVLIPENTVYKYKVISELYDSLGYAAGMFPEMLEMLNDTLNQGGIVNITSELLDKGLLEVSDILPYKSTIQQLITDLVSMPESEVGYSMPGIFWVAGYFNDEEINKFMVKHRSAENKNIAFNILKVLIRNKLDFKTKNIERIAEDPFLRRNLYDFLCSNHSTGLMPENYRSQVSVAESDLYNYMASEEYEISSCRYVGTRDLIYEDTLQRFYLFRLESTYDDDTEVIYQVAGPYPIDTAIAEFSPGVETGIYWSSDDDLSVDEHFTEIEKLLNETSQ